MSTGTPSPASRFSRLLRWIFGIVVVSIFAHLYLDNAGPFMGEHADRLVAGEHRRPFVYRVLTPLVIRGGIEALPDRLVHRLNYSSRGEVPRRLSAMDGYEWSGNRGEVFLLVYVLVFLCGAGLLTTFRGLLLLRGESASMAAVAPPILLLALPNFYTKSGMPYDLPELTLFAAGLLFFLRRRWVAYYAVFALAVLNKETGVLMGMYFLPWLTVGQRQRFGAHAAVHLGIAIPILAAIRWSFRDVPGTGFDPNLAKNLSFFLSPEPWLKFADVYAHQIPFPRAFNLLSLLMVFGPLWVARRGLPGDLLRTFGGMLGVLLPLFLLFGNQDEIRVLAPAAPLLALLLVRAVAVILDRPGSRGSTPFVDGGGTVP